MNMKKLNFESWYSNILEAVNTKEPVAVTTDTETKGAKGPEVETDSSSPSFSREEIISDIDTIMTHLSQLGTQVREELENDDVFDVNEAGEETAMAKVKDFLFAPKYRSMQKKVNKMKMNALDIQITADNLSGAKDSPEAAKKETLQTKKKTIDAQIASLQTAVDDKAKDRGSYVQKVLKSEKIKGQMELVKRASGQEDDPAKKKDLATSMKELQKRFEEEQAAVKDLKDKAEPTPEEKAKAEQDKKDAADAKQKEADKKEKEAADAKIEDLTIKKGELKSKKIAPEDKAAEAQNNLSMAQLDLEIAKLKKDDKAIADAQGRVGEFKQALTDVKSGESTETKTDSTKDKLIAAATKTLDNAKQSGDEEAIKNAEKNLKAVSDKLDWQLQGTELGRILEAEIKLLDNQIKLKESRYTSFSVADKFRQLLS
jgi:hypothetical protein